MPDEPLPPRVRAYLVDDNNFDVLQELVLSYDKTWQEQLNGEGYGSLKLPMFEVGANPGLAQLPYSGGTITGVTSGPAGWSSTASCRPTHTAPCGSGSSWTASRRSR
jgi:hypothetical protein